MLFVLNSLSVGGTETKVIKIANAIARSGVSVELAYLNPPETLLDQIDSSIPITNLSRRGKYSILALRRLSAAVKREQKLVVAVNQYPLLYVIPVVKWWNSRNVAVAGLINASESIGKERLFEKLYAQFLKQCDRIIFGCESQLRDWVEKHRLTRARSQVIYNGVDCAFYSPTCAVEEAELLRRKLEIPDDATIIGTVGRFRPEKSFDHLIMALARLNRSGRESYGLLVGQGQEQERLQKLAVEERIADKVRFLGLQRDVRPALTIMDIFVLPSSTETFSNATLEAMAMARAVVLSEVGGAVEMIENGKSGMLFPAGNVDALSEIIAGLHDSSEMRRELGSAARKRAERLFAFSRMVSQYRALIRS